MGATSDQEKPQTHTLQRVPHSKPPFTLRDLRNTIPPHCFKRPLLKSLYYVLYDFTLAFVFYYLVVTYAPFLSPPFSHLAWVVYAIFQGCVWTGLWVIAHDCGHQAFSDYQWVDDSVGLFIHSILLVPYFSWKYSHRRHHSNNGSLEKDEVFVPKIKSTIPWYTTYLNSPPSRLLTILVTLTLGWPLYLFFNVSGRKYERLVSHFDPYAPLFLDGERSKIFLTDAFVVLVSYGLYHLYTLKSLVWLLGIYFSPLLVVNGFLVLITWLQHTHPSLPRYDSTEWDWLRGAMVTVDRDYGILNKVFHNIADTHVVHHFFSKIPHYHAMEATNAIKPIMGDYYQYDGTMILKAIWREAKECVYVEADENESQIKKGVYWYKNMLSLRKKRDSSIKS